MVPARGDDAATIGLYVALTTAFPMSRELSEQAPAVGLPHPRRIVLARGDDVATIGAIRRAQDATPWPSKTAFGAPAE